MRTEPCFRDCRTGNRAKLNRIRVRRLFFPFARFGLANQDISVRF